MGFPEFDRQKKRLLFFSRGRGRGHAVPDIEILRALETVDAEIEARVVSYGLGADTFTALGYPVIDLGLPDESPIAEMSVLAGKLIGWLNPGVVTAHEEFAVMPAAKIFDKAAIFVTDFFTSHDSYSMHALKFADHVLFLGNEGVFEPPLWVREKVQYVGRVLRKFDYALEDRARARTELAIADDEFVILVLPGSWPECDTPLLHLVRSAFDRPGALRKKIIWVASVDRDAIASGLSECDALVLDMYWQIDRLMVAADVAITKTNRVTVFELHSLGVPTIALSWGLNPIDDQAVKGLHEVCFLTARDLTPDAFASVIESVADQPRMADPPSNTPPAKTCARVIAGAFK